MLCWYVYKEEILLSFLLLKLSGTEFIHLISSDANEICEQESKKTIAPEHIIGALKVCPVSPTNDS